MRGTLFLTIGLLFLNLTEQVNALDIEISKDQPMEILSDEVKYYNLNNKAIFSGDVKITQDNLVINSPSMEILFIKNDGKKLKDENNNGANIDLIKFKEKIDIKTLNESASANNGEYNVAKGILKLNGNVVLKQDDNIMTGDELIYVKATGESLLRNNNTGNSNKSRVKAYIVPKNH